MLTETPPAEIAVVAPSASRSRAFGPANSSSRAEDTASPLSIVRETGHTLPSRRKYTRASVVAPSSLPPHPASASPATRRSRARFTRLEGSPVPRIADDLRDSPPQVRVIEVEQQSEAPRGLLLERLEEVDRLPQCACSVSDVVVGVRLLERGERTRIRPSLEPSAGVEHGSVGVDRKRVPADQRDEQTLQ